MPALITYHLGTVFCLLLRLSSDYAQPITGQVTEVTLWLAKHSLSLLRARDRKRAQVPHSIVQPLQISSVKRLCSATDNTADKNVGKPTSQQKYTNMTTDCNLCKTIFFNLLIAWIQMLKVLQVENVRYESNQNTKHWSLQINTTWLILGLLSWCPIFKFKLCNYTDPS